MPRRKVKDRKIVKALEIIGIIAGIVGTLIAVVIWTTDRPKIEIKLKVDPLVLKTPDASLKNKDVYKRFVHDLVTTLFRQPIAEYLERHNLPSKEFEKNVLETRKQLLKRLTGMTVCFPYKVSIMNNGNRNTTIVSALLTVNAMIDPITTISKITLANNESIPAGSLREYNGKLEFTHNPDPNLVRNPLDTWVDKSVVMWLHIEDLPPEIFLSEIEGDYVDYVFKVTCEDQYGNRTSKSMTLEQISFLWLNKSLKTKDKAG